MKIKDKKAQMHIEIILSFVLFLSAVMIILFFLNPVSEKKSNIDMDIIQDKILNYLVEPVGVMSVIIDLSGGCYVLPSEYGNNFLEVEDSRSDRNYILYFSDSLDNEHPHNLASEDCLDSYSFGMYLEDEIIFYDNLKELIGFDEGMVKTNLGINNYINVRVLNKDRSVVPELVKESQINFGNEVIAREFPIRVINKDGVIQELILNIRAWQ